MDETPILVHAAAIAKLSDPLNFLINGPTKEAQENEAKLSHLVVEDFERICEFAYRGEYQVPNPYAAGGRDGDHPIDAGNELEQEERSTDASDSAWNLSQHFLAKAYLKSSTPMRPSQHSSTRSITGSGRMTIHQFCLAMRVSIRSETST